MWEVGVHSSNDAPDPDPVPAGEGRTRNMRENHPADLVCELQTPRAQEGHKCGRVDDSGVVILWLREPRNLNASGCHEGEQEQ